MNKKLFLVLHFSALLFFVSCSKEDSPIFCVKEIPINTTHLISNDLLNQMDYRLDVIEDSGSFQIRSYTTDSYGEYAKCNQYYKELPIFFYDVNFIFTGGITIIGDIVDTINIGLESQITFERAAKIAHEKIKSKECYGAKLGIFDLNMGSGPQPEFRLAWEITSAENKYPYAIIDAQNENIIRYFDGRRN